jgi:hypothetical protein
MYKNVEDREKYDKEYYAKNKEKRKKQQAEYYEKNKEKLKQKMREWGKANRNYMEEYHQDKERKKIRMLSRYKFRNSKEECSVCETKENLELHHIKYTRDDIVVVCRKCHCEIHKNKD